MNNWVPDRLTLPQSIDTIPFFHFLLCFLLQSLADGDNSSSQHCIYKQPIRLATSIFRQWLLRWLASGYRFHKFSVASSFVCPWFGICINHHFFVLCSFPTFYKYRNRNYICHQCLFYICCRIFWNIQWWFHAFGLSFNNNFIFGNLFVHVQRVHYIIPSWYWLIVPELLPMSGRTLFVGYRDHFFDFLATGHYGDSNDMLHNISHFFVSLIIPVILFVF